MFKRIDIVIEMIIPGEMIFHREYNGNEDNSYLFRSVLSTFKTMSSRHLSELNFLLVMLLLKFIDCTNIRKCIKRKLFIL